MSEEYICKYRGCQRKFKTLYNRNKHRNLHNLPPKYICDCGKEFIEKSAYSRHMRRHDFLQRRVDDDLKNCLHVLHEGEQ